MCRAADAQWPLAKDAYFSRYHFRIAYPGNTPQRKPAPPQPSPGTARGEITSPSLGTVGVAGPN